MNTILRLLSVGLVLAAPVAALAQSSEVEIPRTAGKVLVLDNDRIMQGDVVREGDRYRVRRNAGETWVPADKVRMVCDSLDEVYRGLRSRANPRDVDELLKLARWCRQHGLREQGLKDAQAIVELRPTHPEAQRLVKYFQKPPADSNHTATAKESEPPLPASFGLTLDSLGLFSSRVQPILMNTCANCHTTNHPGPFKLVRAYSDGSTNRRATQQNIAAVVSQINPDAWASSPFLIKAVSIHGESAKPPLKGRQTPAYQILEEWVRQAINDMPREAVSVTKPATEPHVLSERTAFAATPMPAVQSAKTPEAPVPVGPVDPYDPAEFNRQKN